MSDDRREPDAPFSWGLTPKSAQPDEPATVEPAEPEAEAEPTQTPEPAEPPTQRQPAPAQTPASAPTSPSAVDYGDPTEAYTIVPDQPVYAPIPPAAGQAPPALPPEPDFLADSGQPADSALDALFADDKFREHEPEPLFGALTAAGAAGAAGAAADNGADPAAAIATKPRRQPGDPFPKSQRILLWVAGGLLAVLALAALFFLGTRLADSLSGSPAPTPSASPTPTPSPTPTAVALGPVAPGDYDWRELLGTECLEPFVSAWEESFTVVDCATPHAGQLVGVGTFAGDGTNAYPGADALQSQINLLCTAPTIIDYAAAGAFTDIVVSASFAADEAEWTDGNRGYSCFVNRSSGEPLTSSIAVPQVAPAPAP